ncbi:pimeloyl-ACP methyl ester carboxylesterase [Kordia periserrulae]|uniref:Pimeloyl-ACP methyl ester carboxylesterase n=1 Tax=Kordia periserrulae TaxID=701523 RepID=A0A2T6C3H2_9FLAO|nr:alpha/beta hydrolase [Kordia periserrulae]PTX62871.1 pimeloyl-ACP methyl ester carboxylesterase [Kordia periserrulae]
MSASKIQVYFMPGMAANPSIFKHITLPEDEFEVHFLTWFVPEKGETLSNYALRMTQKIQHDNVVLIGVSFGGILVQEMARHINVKKIFVVSSVKTKYELPRRMRFARATKIYKLFPTSLVNNIEVLRKFAFGDLATKRLELYEEFLSVRDKYYLDWSIAQIVNWKQEEPLPNTVHIHGEKDRVFPIKYISDCIPVKGGTHIMILNKFKWFNENLPRFIKE